MKIGNKDVARIDINSKALSLYEDFQNLIDKKLTSVSAAMLDGCTKIGSYTFFAQNLLTSCKIPNSVTLLEISSFQTCTALTNIDIPSGVGHLAAQNIFRGCTALTDVIIRSPSFSAFGSGVFYDNVNLKNLWLYATSTPRIGNVTTGNVSETFGGTWSSGTHTLHVPAGSVSAYNNGTGNWEWSKYFDKIHGFLQDGKNARYVLYCDLTDEEVSDYTSLLTFNLLDSDDDTGSTVDTVTVSAQDHEIVLSSERSIAISSGIITLSYSDPAPTVIDLTSLLSDTTGYLKITELTDAGKEHLYTLV